MDILNWLYIKKEQLIRTKANNPDTDLVALGANVGFNKRDDQYQTYAMPLKYLVQEGNVANTAHYELDISQLPYTVTVNTPRGIIDIINTDSGGGPDPAFVNPYIFAINNPELDLTVANRDNIYIQYSVYYKQQGDDNAIPYLLATGFVPDGLQFNLYNANGAVAGADQWKGALYVYYELYTIN